MVNGELYDYERLRASSEAWGYKFHSRSDSELVLALYAQYGLAFVDHLRGEFAFCLYDQRNKLFVAVKDRFGIKPLFWRIQGGELWIASEQKAWLGLGWEAEWDVRAIATGGWMQDAGTIFKGCYRLMPAHMMIVREGRLPEIKRYWQNDYPDKRIVDPRTDEEMILEMRRHLIEAVRLRMTADVPVGIYLSGGIDSSTVAGIAKHLVQDQGVKMHGRGDKSTVDQITCFTIAFEAAMTSTQPIR